MNCKNTAFIIKGQAKFGDKYSYENTNYVKSTVKVDINCPLHGVFSITPNNYLNSKFGCSKCAIAYFKGAKTSNKEDFISKANLIYNFFYDYSKVEYIHSKSKITIICPIHGEFSQIPTNHLSNRGCLKCGFNKTSNSTRLHFEEFLNRARLVHGLKYDYTKVNYVNKDKLVKIICPKHGDFLQSPANHCRRKAGCPICKESQGEKSIRVFFENKKINFISQMKFQTCKNKYLLPFDFAIFKNDNLFGLIEYNGEQHYKPMGFGGNAVSKFQRNLLTDDIKLKWCENNKIPLLIISYLNYNKINILLEEFISSI